MYLSAAPKFPAQPRIVCGTITEGSSALCLISFVNPLNAVAAGSPAHRGISTSRHSPGGALPPDEAIPGLGTTAQAASLGRGTHTWVKQDADAGKTVWRSEGGGKETEGKGKAAWCPSFPTHAASQRGSQYPRGISPHEQQKLTPGAFSVFSLRVKGTGFPNGAEGPTCPPTPGIPSPRAGHTPSLLFGKSQPFPWPQKKDRYRPQPTATPCRSSGCF